MNSDIRLSIGFFDHPKTIKLERQLGLEGVIALMRLWLWAAQNRPSGILSGMDKDDIEIAARWNGVQGSFIAAVTAVKFLNCVDGVHHIHDWQEHNAWQSDAENRSNASRLSRMAKTHPEIYKILDDAGIKGISREVYAAVTASNDPKAAAERLSANPLSPFLTSPCLSSPLPSSPSEEERESSLRSDSLSGPDGQDEKMTLDMEVLPYAKDRPPKAKQESLPEDSDAFCLAVLMRDTLKANVPTLKEPNLQKWAQTFAIALRNDDRMKEAQFVAEVIRWACSDSFWRANIQSPAKLREKFDQLTARMESAAEKERTSAKAKWISPAQRRVETNLEAGQDAKRLLFGECAGAEMGVTHDAS